MNDGGPAFPCKWYDFQPLTGEQVVREQWGGMTLRDYFAAKAMHAIITEPTYEGAQSFLMYFKKRLGLKGEGMDAYAQVAYMMADAMLRARENTKGRRDAAPAVQGEPVAYISQEDFEFLLSDDMSNQYGTRQVPVFSRKGCRASVPLYASPQP